MNHLPSCESARADRLLPGPAARCGPLMAGRAGYAIAASVFGAFLVYGSLFPLEFQLRSLDDVRARVGAVRLEGTGAISGTDVLANVLLSIPLGFCLVGAFRAHPQRILKFLRTAFVAAAVVFILSIAVEVAQIFVSGRTPSEHDVLAQVVGCGIGILIWPVVGPGLTALLVEFPGSRSSRIERSLLVYVALLAAAQLMPLDVTLTPHELAQKYREGLINFDPFVVPHNSWDSLFELAVKAILYAPLGVLTTLIFARAGWRRSRLIGWGASTATAVLVEGAQILIRSRQADITDVLVESAAIGLAALLTGTVDLSKEPATPPNEEYRMRYWAAAGLFGWVVVLAGYHWFPFDFVFDLGIVKDRVPHLVGLPFAGYFSGSDLHGAVELLNKMAIAMPFGMLLRVVWPPVAHPAVARLQTAVLLAGVGVLFAAIEVGQLFLPGRFPDAADVLIGTAAAAIGLRLTRGVKSAFQTGGVFIAGPTERTSRVR